MWLSGNCCGVVLGIGKHSEIYAVLDIYKTSYQKRIAKKLLKARKKTDDLYHNSIFHPILSNEGEIVDLERLNILLDFEVARRLQDSNIVGGPLNEAFHDDIAQSKTRNTQRAQNQGHESWKRNYMNSDRDMLDRVPVGSAIVGALKLSVNADQNELSLQDFFHAPNTHSAGYRSGTYSAFEGVPDGGHRSSATKKIIRKFRGDKKAKHSKREDIHQELLEVFGGDSESDGAPYSDTSDDD